MVTLRCLTVGILLLLAGAKVCLAQKINIALPPSNEWHLLNHEPKDGGKEFARAIYADTTRELILWGTGGNKPTRNVYERYELEVYGPGIDGWVAAFPQSKNWTADNYPPFRIYGQTGPDGLKFHEGPRLRTVSGNARFNRIQWWDFDGYGRPSPVLTFNQACWDSKRKRVLYHADGKMIALDPETRQWADLETPNYPDTCRALAWGMMAYDSGKDRVLLFGGGLATNPIGAAPTWFYDCEQNRWERPKLETEPPSRCNGALIYDAKTASFVLFGGYDMAAALNDTWIFDCKSERWEKRTPKPAAPPMYEPAHAVLPGGKLFVCGNDARTIKMTHISQTSATKESWVYDIDAGTWTPVHAGLELPGVRWMTADTKPGTSTVTLVSFGPDRRTFSFEYDPEKLQPVDLPGAPPDTVAWKYPEQKLSLEAAPPPDPEAHAEFLKDLPVNQFVDAKSPGLLISKTWSTATIDTDRSEVIYTGGGHSGYSGNDFARYSIAENRWTLDQPPRFPPYLERASGGCFGWSYGQLPFSQHTYLWYDYDPVSKCVLYLARPSLIDGIDVHNRGETFTYDAKTHGFASWAYDSAGRKSHPPSFGRTFRNPWHLAVKGTPEGIFVATDGNLHRGAIDPETGEVTWKQIDNNFPKPREQIQKYHYEFQPLLHDTRRNRLVQLKGVEDRVDVFVRPLTDEGAWEQLETAGTASIGREAVYLEDDDTILWLENRRLFTFDCAENRMGEIDVELPEGSYTHECAMVYDPKQDVCVALIPSRFTGPLQTLLFRFDRERAKLK